MTENLEIARPFDYAGLDAETRIVVQQRTSEIKTIARRAAADIIEIGGKLIEVKGRLGHGRFGAWLAAEFAWSQDMASRFMAVSTKFGAQIPQIAEFAPSALYLLASPSIPDEARAEAVTRAGDGERITVAKAQEIVQTYTPRWASLPALTVAIRAWLAAWPAPATQRAIARTMVDNTAAGPAHLDRLLRSGKLPAPFRREDVIAVLRDLADGKVEVEAEAITPVKTEDDIIAAAAALQPAVWRWLTPPPDLAPRAALQWQAHLTGSLLDLEGFAARRGRNFDWEALVGAVGNGVDHAALRLAVGQVRAAILSQLAGLDASEAPHSLTPDPCPLTPDPRPLAPVVIAWLDSQVESNDLPDYRDARRLVLSGILTSRNNGYQQQWRALRRFEQWPAGVSDEDKLAAVRTALAEIAGRPAPQPVYAEARTPAHTGAARPIVHRPAATLDRSQITEQARLHHIVNRLTVALDLALAWLKDYARAFEHDPEDDLAALIATLETARAEAQT